MSEETKVEETKPEAPVEAVVEPAAEAAQALAAEAVAAEAPASEPKKSVKELKEALLLLVEMANAGIEIAKDGKIGLDDVGTLLKIVPALGPAISGVTEIPSEVSDIDAEEVAELVGAVVAKLAVDDQKARLIIEKSLKTAAAVAELVMAIVK